MTAFDSRVFSSIIVHFPLFHAHMEKEDQKAKRHFVGVQLGESHGPSEHIGVKSTVAKLHYLVFRSDATWNSTVFLRVIFKHNVHPFTLQDIYTLRKLGSFF